MLSQTLVDPTPENRLGGLLRFFPAAYEVSSDVISPEDFASSQIPRGFLNPYDLCVVRPAIFTDGHATGKYRVAQEGEISGCYQISREDTGEFISRLCEGRQADAAEKWFGHQVVIAY